MFTLAWFVTAKNGTQFRYPFWVHGSAHRGIPTAQHRLHIETESRTDTQNNGCQSPGDYAKWGRGGSPSQETTYCIIPCTEHLWLNRITELENRTVTVRARGWEDRSGEGAAGFLKEQHKGSVQGRHNQRDTVPRLCKMLPLGETEGRVHRSSAFSLATTCESIIISNKMLMKNNNDQHFLKNILLASDLH